MSSSVDLDKLKAAVEEHADAVKKFKTEGASKEAIGEAVKKLLAAKQEYADNNNGLGIDGKPYPPPKQEKAKKAKGEAKPQANPNSVNAQKKAAKKAAKKQAAQARKAGGTAAAGAGAAAGGAPGAAARPKPQQAPPRRVINTNTKLQPLQIAINPNSELRERPVVALTAAILTNTILDLSLQSDFRIHQTMMGLENNGIVVGDLAMARYLVRRSGSPNLLLGVDHAQEALVDAWVDYASSLTALDKQQRIKAVSMTMQHSISTQTYLVGSSLTLADFAVFAAIGFPSQAADRNELQSALPDTDVVTKRWISMMASLPAIREATQLAVGIANNTEAAFDGGSQLDPLAEGMNLLEGAVPGQVVTRFPPEPSGYLHIGHAKACLLNDYYAQRYQGRLIVRFDDTNPSKEKEEFQQAIVEDLGKLGIEPDMISYTSDYFGTIRGYAEYLIQNGLAYMDDTPQEQMKAERMEKIESKHRNSQSPAEALRLFQEMCKGAAEGSKWCLRAKIDMQSVNGTMRDPVLYRQNLEPHHRSGTTYKAYPTYDLACPIVDSLEGVTHALRTTEYNDRDEQYQWIQTALCLRRVRIHAFARMNFMYTELSKRKLTWFVENGHVTGWDDPRFPTVRGVVRRGISIKSLRQYMYSQGASRRVVNMEWSKFWAENKNEIDKTAKRFMAIDKDKHVVLNVTDGPSVNDHAFVTTDYHPKKPEMGKRVVRIANQVLLEAVDAQGIEVGEDIVLVRWGVVKITKVDDGGLEGTFVPDGDFKAAKKKLSWIANVPENTPCVLTEFDNLISKEKLEENDNFQDFINPNTIASSFAIGDAGLKNLQENEIFQLERRGYYRVDRPYISEEKPLVLFMVPDGKSKAMSGLAGKLAHR